MNQQPTPSSEPTLLFIPDISGFTRFVNDTEITHSRHIIEELLEILIDADEIGLTVSEIEGDAILFYRDGQAPTAAALLAQVQRMYVNFHAHLKKYEAYRICQCGACSTASDLTIKFIVHYGDVGTSHVREHSKLFGKDVIVAHRLMKNEVPHREYVLLTHQLVTACSNWVAVKQAAWADPEEGEETYDFGSINYCFITLDPLKDHVPQPTMEDFHQSGATKKIMEHETVLEAPIELVFNVLSDLSIRHEWMVGVKDSDRLNSKITRNGSTHRCVMKGTENDPFFVSHNFQVGQDFVTFVDSNHKDGIDAVFTLRRIGNQVTRMQVFYYMKRNVVKEFLFRLFMKKKFMEVAAASSRNLNDYCRALLQEGKQPPSQILLKPAAAGAA